MSNRLTAILAITLAWCLSLSAETESRTWTNRSGTKLEATYLAHDAQTVTIKRATDGQEFQLPVEKLSDEDQAWLKALDPGSGVGSGPGLYIAVGNGLHRLSSNDGRTWSNHAFKDKPSHDQNDLKAIAIGNGACVVVGGFSKSNILTTRDGVEWHINDFNMGVLSGVIFHEGRFLSFGEGGRVGASEDGLKWTQIGDAKLRDHLNAEAEKLGLDERIKSNIRRWRQAGGRFVGSGDNGILVSTSDFESWTFSERIEPRSRLFIETDGTSFVVHGERTLHHSADGVTWTDVSPELDEKAKFRGLVHDGERFIAHTRDGRGWESPDGKVWKAIEGATFPGTLATLSPDLYYAFETYWKYTEDLKLSTDKGKTWESATLPAPAGITNIIFAEGFPNY